MKDPMHDIQFLLALDNDHNKIIYAKVISLTKDEQPIEAIEGVVQSGSINIDGSSAVRRSCNLTMTTKMLNINEVYWGFTTKVKLEIGLQNNIDPQYDKIIWFKQGIYILTDFKTSQQVNNYTITLAGKDKMCLLNGDISGHFNAETNLSIEDRYDANGNKTEYNQPIKYIIREMIHHYAQEPWANIIINNVEDYGLEMLDNHSENKYYLWRNDDGAYEYITAADFSLPKGQEEDADEYLTPQSVTYNNVTYTNLDNLPSNFIFLNGMEEDANGLVTAIIPSEIVHNGNNYQLFKIPEYGAAGYRRTDLTYDKELIAAAGDTVTSILDKLVKMLGSFEYFYNLDGQFVFQAKDSYFNSVWSAAEVLNTAQALSYIDPALIRNKVSYYFENGKLTTAIQNNPNLLNVRNDFTIWGKKKTSTGSELPIHARYAIDKKPLFYKKVRYQDRTAEEIENDPYDLASLYITKECLELLKKKAILTRPDPNDYHNLHPLPNAFKGIGGDPDNWWNMQDWGEYYKAFTGVYPSDRISKYQATDASNQGYKGNLYFANGVTLNYLNPIKVHQSSGIYNADSKNALCVVDIQRLVSNSTECQPAGFLNMEGNILHTSYNAFMHRFNGCSHTYSYFLDLVKHNHYESYFYRPILNFDNETHYAGNTLEGNAVRYFEDHADQVVDWRELIYQMSQDYYQYNHEDDFELHVALANREISQTLGMLDYYTGKTGYEQYYHDIEGFWRLLYDPANKNNEVTIENWKIAETNVTVTYNADGWNKLIDEDPTELLFWFDFYETDTSSIGRFSIPAIGDRTKIVNDDDVRVIVYPDVPDIVYVGDDITDDDIALSTFNGGYSYLQIPDGFVNRTFSLAVRRKSAKEVMDNLLYQYSHTNDSITLTTIPIYYLQPNTIIHVHDDLSHIDGYYEVTKITIPLAYNGTMNISAVKIPQQIY